MVGFNPDYTENTGNAATTLSPRLQCLFHIPGCGFSTECSQASLRTLYAEFLRITPVPPVLPRLLARNWPGLLTSTASLSPLPKELYSNCRHSLTKHRWIRVSSIVQYSPLLPLLSQVLVSVPVWLYIRSDQLKIIGLGDHYSPQLPNFTRSHHTIINFFQLKILIYSFNNSVMRYYLIPHCVANYRELLTRSL